MSRITPINFLDDKFKNENGTYNMQKALQTWAAQERAIGRNEGINSALSEGRTNTIILVSKIYHLIKLNPDATNEYIATSCECTLTDVTDIRNTLNI